MNKVLKIITRAIVIDQDKILLVKKSDADFWHFPGGKWEFENESLERAIQRELIEETGYQINPAKIIFTQELRENKKVYLELFWRAELTSIEQAPIAEDEEIQTHRWFTVADLINQEVNFKPNNSTIADILQSLT